MEINLRQASPGTLLLFFLLIIFVVVSSCSTPLNTNVRNSGSERTSNSALSPNAVANNKQISPPKSLADAGEYGENIYDLAKVNNWPGAQAKLDALKNAAKKLQTEGVGTGSEVSQVGRAIVSLEQAVTAKDRQATMREANQITLIVANMTAQYKLVVPVEVTKLDYLGRELEIWSAANDTGKLEQTSQTIRQTWNAIRPSVEAHGGTAEAKKFEELVSETERAKSATDYQRVAKRLLDEVDNLEKVFEK